MDRLDRATQLRSAVERAGVATADVPARAALFEQAWDEFVHASGRSPRWAWWVPGRIEVFGKHTDYAGGRSLLATVPRGFAVVAGPREDGLVSARDARWHSAMDVHPTEDSRAFAGWANYIAVVARRLALNFPGASLGADLAFASDLPRAAGMSSSSALVVGVATALIRRAGLERRPEWAAAIRGPLDLAGYLGAVENGLTFGPLAGLSGVGTHGGSEDHTAILNCQAGRLSAFSYLPVLPVGDAAFPAAWRFVLMSSGVEAAKAGAARGRYNNASLATRALVDVWIRHVGRAASTLAGVLASGPEAESSLRQALRTLSHPDFTADALDDRLSHFIAEDGRVPQALAAVREGNAAALGDLSSASQRDAERLLKNQVAETSALAALARECGAFASSSFGAGFGGSVWATTEAGDADSLADRWRRTYLDRYPTLRNVGAFVATPGPGVVEISLSE